jgi:hypothetical protein
MGKRFTATEKWEDPWYRKLPCRYRDFWQFILDRCDNAGVWIKDFEGASFFIGETITEEEVWPAINNGKERLKILNGGSRWLVVDFVNFQFGTLSTNSRVHRSIMALQEKHKNKGYLKGIHTLKDKDKDKDKEKDKDKDKDNKDTTEIATLTLKTSFITQKQKVYPMLDIEGEIRKCVDWFTTKGIKIRSWERTITNWLKKSYDNRGVIAQQSVRKPQARKDCTTCNGTGRVAEGSAKGAQCYCVS